MARVRLFTHEGMISAPASSYSGQGSANAIWLLQHPYLSRQAFDISTGAAVSSDPAVLAPTDFSKILRVEVDEGVRIRFEVTKQNQTPRIADQDSPILYGEDQIPFGKGYAISIIQAT